MYVEEREHTVPFKVEGKTGSVSVDNTIPAPAGVGLTVGDVGKTILKLAGITADVAWSQTGGPRTQTSGQLCNATFETWKQLTKVKQ